MRGLQVLGQDGEGGVRGPFEDGVPVPVTQLSPVLTLNRFSSSSSGRLYCAPNLRPSATAFMLMPRTRLLTSFAARLLPGLLPYRRCWEPTASPAVELAEEAVVGEEQ